MQAYSRGLLGNCRRVETRRSLVIGHANVSFSVQKQVGWGDKLIIVGDRKSLGSWKVDGAAELRWGKDDVWTGSVEIPNNCDVEFKVVKVTGHGDTQWENGDNRKFHVEDKDVVLQMEWGKTGEVKQSAVSAEKQTPSQNGTSSEASGSDSESQYSDSNGTSISDDRLPHTKWQGKDIDFMKENKHTKERRGVWNKDGLEGSILDLVQGDEGAASWLQKLEVAKSLIVDKSVDMRPDLEALAPLYIYLSWICTGSIQCVEGGGHYRPNRHAELSKVMFRSMEWVSGDHKKTALERLVARKLVAKLPSFSEAFTASVPLTRIRDIAHRNDIPSDLKREIKHTLQNKLHRNAGPEDLVATELMLERITEKPGEYSEAFVNEFKVFTEELRDFFSAGSLAFLLEAVLPAMDDNERTSVQRFLEAKSKVDSAAAADMNLLMDLLHKLTTVRAILLAKLASGLRNDAPDAAMVMRQRVRLAEIRCEDYGYMTLSRVNNLLEEQGGSTFLAGAREEAWAQPIGAMVLAVRHCGLSGWQPGECYAIEQELETWQKLGVLGDKEQLIRLKATLERTKRLTDDYAEVMLNTFANPALTMGQALGMPSEVQQVFTEAEIRANVAFQLSKLTTSLLKASRSVLGSGDFDPLVTGSAIGELVAVERISAGKELAGGRPCVLLVQEADGDEEVAAAGKNIRGVILCQDLPHLSHLGVRARQEGVTFVTTTTTEVIDSTVKPLIGKQVELIADGSHVTFRAASETTSAPKEAPPKAPSSNGSTPPVPVAVPSASIKKVTAATVVALHSATTESCGAKAAACAKLSDAARKSAPGAAFSAPAGAVLPFGCMEVAIKAAGRTAEFEDLLKQMETCAADALQPLCDEMQALISQCSPDAASLAALQKELPDAAIVIARSSANVEDLAGMSGAGLYESVPNLELSSVESLSKGVTQVWASLFTRRAVLSRRAANVAQKDACMAVLVQEMLAPDTCFVLHTRNPMADSDSDRGVSSLYAEVAPGMGEILASGTRGSAWRMTVDKATSKVATLAYANFSHAFLPSTGERVVEPGASIYWTSQDGDDGVTTAVGGKVSKKTVDYSKQQLSVNSDRRTELAQQLCRIGVALEDMFDAPQDIEGALVGSRIYVVQTRPQP